jgi:hypothetical protein
MQVEFIVNGGVSIIFSPDNQMEEELIKGLMKQHNEIQEFRTAVTILNKTFRNGIVIGKKSNLEKKDPPITGEKAPDNDKS